MCDVHLKAALDMPMTDDIDFNSKAFSCDKCEGMRSSVNEAVASGAEGVSSGQRVKDEVHNITWGTFKAVYSHECVGRGSGGMRIANLTRRCIELDSSAKMCVKRALRVLRGIFRSLTVEIANGGNGVIHDDLDGNVQGLFLYLTNCLDLLSVFSSETPLATRNDTRFSKVRRVAIYLGHVVKRNEVYRTRLRRSKKVKNDTELKRKCPVLGLPSSPPWQLIQDMRTMTEAYLAFGKVYLNPTRELAKHVQESFDELALRMDRANQNPLENTFGGMRQYSGGMSMPFVQQVDNYTKAQMTMGAIATPSVRVADGMNSGHTVGSKGNGTLNFTNQPMSRIG
jgi:hypothetical protein